MPPKNKNSDSDFVSYIRQRKYIPDFKTSVAQRIVECLKVGAERFPGQLLPFNLLHLAVLGGKQPLPLDHEDVQKIRGRMSDVRLKLQTQYSCNLVQARGLGVRATYSPDDIVSSGHHSVTKAVETAKVRLAKFTDLVDEDRLTSTENKVIMSNLNFASKHLSVSAFVSKLRPPQLPAKG